MPSAHESLPENEELKILRNVSIFLADFWEKIVENKD